MSDDEGWLTHLSTGVLSHFQITSANLLHHKGKAKALNSLLWCGLFIFSVGYSVYEIAKFLSVKDLVFLIHYLAFYLVGYSPDKWYERKTIPQNTQA